MKPLPLGTRYSIFPAVALPHSIFSAVESIPGVHFRKKGAGKFISAPVDAAWIVASVLDAAGVQYGSSIDMRKVPAGLPRSPEEVADRLLRSELRDGIWNDWLLGFQKTGIEQLAQAGGGHLWWKPGCLTGDAEIIINRGGGARRTRLDHLVTKFNGGSVPRPQGGRPWEWKKPMPVRTASLDDEGFLRLNRIVAAVESGVKPVWEVEVEDGRSRLAQLDGDAAP